MYDNSNNNRYLYNGKEIQTDLANQYDYGARFYDPVIGRWTAIDPLVEVGQETGTPYGYVYDDPIKFTDPDGRAPEGCCRTAKLILGFGLAASGGMVAVAAPTVVGETVAVPAAIALTGATLVVSGVALIFDSFRNDEPSSSSYHSESTPAPEPTNKPRGSNIPKVKDAAKTGQEAHRQKQKEAKDQHGDDTEIEKPIQLPDGTNVRKDVVLPDGTPIIIKPNTPSGQKSGAKRKELLEKNGYNGKDKPSPKIDTYDPNNPAYQPGSPTYIGPGVKF